MRDISLIKKTSLAAMIVLSLPSVWAQPGVSPYYKAPTSYSGRTIVIPAGTTFEGRIESNIGSSISKQGQRFTITLSSPLLANGSDVLVPAGAEVLGEVVQAIPANKVPHAKKEKPIGKLRIQVTALKMPNGTTYPMVASIIGEESVRDPRNPYGNYNPYNNSQPAIRGSGVAYLGTPTGFESVAPGRARYDRSGAPSVVTRNELLNDPVMGREKGISSEKLGMRSLVKKNRNLFIYNGSPLTIRLEAPFKMGIGTSPGEESTLGIPSSTTSTPPVTDTSPPPSLTNQGKSSPNTAPKTSRDRSNQESNF